MTPKSSLLTTGISGVQCTVKLIEISPPNDVATGMGYICIG